MAVIDQSCIAEIGNVSDVFTHPKSDIAKAQREFAADQQKFKQLGDTFLRGLLYTKNHALEAAARLVAGVSAQTVEEETACKVRKNPDADTLLQQVYQAQLSEITLLTEHYRRLLSTQAADYAAMVREAYRPGEVQLFLVELAQR